MTADRPTPPAPTGIFMLMNGFHVAGAVSCLAQLGIPDLIEALRNQPTSWQVRSVPTRKRSTA